MQRMANVPMKCINECLELYTDGAIRSEIQDKSNFRGLINIDKQLMMIDDQWLLLIR